MAPSWPERIGRYEIVDRLGEGGMGVVYLATDPALERTIAIKLLTSDNDMLRRRFAREARSAAALKHQNIVTIYDVGVDEGRPYIAMEFLDGETLADLISRQAPVPIDRKLELLIELCNGLGYAHRRGIIHRDIKPANLMVTADGVLKILDFGIAHVGSDTTAAGLTRQGMLIGTPNYMSPEQAEGRPVDPRSDIFSVGLVAFEFLSGHQAFQGATPLAILASLLHSEPRDLRAICPDIDSEVGQIAATCLAKDPNNRYQSLAALGAALTRTRHRLRASATILLPAPPEIPAGAAGAPDTDAGADTFLPDQEEATGVKSRRQEEQRLGQESIERLEAARLEQERLEAARLEREQIEAARLDQERLEAARLEQERFEAARLERERLEAARLERERLEAARREREQIEAARLNAEATSAEGRAAPHADRAGPRLTSLRFVAAAVLLVAAITGAWWALRPSRSLDEPLAPVEPVALDYTRTIRSAEQAFEDGDVSTAIALARSIPDAASEGARSRDLLRRVAAGAATAAASARQRAEGAGGSSQPAFQEGTTRQTAAAALTEPADTEQAVRLYEEASQLFDRAASAGWPPEQLVARANQVLASGNTPLSITYALDALGKSPAFQPALAFLSSRRQDAANRSAAARTRATAAGGDRSPDFAQGASREREAGQLTSPRETANAVRLFGDAEAAYVRAQEAAVAEAAAESERARRAAADFQTHLEQVNQRLAADDPEGARAAFELARAIDPSHRDLPPLDRRIRDAAAAATARREALARDARDRQRIEDGLALSRKQSDAEALKTLEQLRVEFPDNAAVRAEIAGRTPPPPPPPPVPTDREVILTVLNDFAAAYNTKSLDGIRRVWPAIPNDVLNSYKLTFDTSSTLEWSYEGEPVLPATIATRVTADAVVRVVRTGQRQERLAPDLRACVFNLEKVGQAWRIVGQTCRGR